MAWLLGLGGDAQKQLNPVLLENRSEEFLHPPLEWLLAFGVAFLEQQFHSYTM
jgi:hypothetical protein